jgi:hypothetical protein
MVVYIPKPYSNPLCCKGRALRNRWSVFRKKGSRKKMGNSSRNNTSTVLLLGQIFAFFWPEKYNLNTYKGFLRQRKP